jgi:hypothetical protein
MTPVHPAQFADQRRQARAVASLMLRGHLGFEHLATSRTHALLEDEMADLHLDWRQLDHLMGVVRRE